MKLLTYGLACLTSALIILESDPIKSEPYEVKTIYSIGGYRVLRTNIDERGLGNIGGYYCLRSDRPDLPVARPKEITRQNERDVLSRGVQSSSEDIRGLIRQYFPENYEVALAIARAESELNPKAIHQNTNGSIDRGIFQINSVHLYRVNSPEELFDLETNIKVAHQIYQESGWRPWTTYTSGKYLNYLED